MTTSSNGDLHPNRTPLDRQEYVDLDGRVLPLAELDAGERELIEKLQARALQGPDWNDYDNYWLSAVDAFYKARGLTRQQVVRTAAYRIGQDLCSRIGIKAGMVRPADYRDELEGLIRERFSTRREFCAATGLTEDMLSHVLAKRKHLAVDTLADALAKIGYTLHIAPQAEV
jgi:hypothetical protein